jgi:hypothetical protein
MKWVTPEKWNNFICSENTPREAALTDFAIRVATNKEAIASLQSDVAKIQDADANEQFEIVRFNYEFISKKVLGVEINLLRSALSALEKSESKYSSHKRKQEKLEVEWREKCKRANFLRIQVDTVLKPQRISFSPPRVRINQRQKELVLDYSNLEVADFLEQRSYFWGLIETSRLAVNQHMKNSGDISLIRPMVEWHQIMLDLDGMVPNFNRDKKFADEFEKKQEKFRGAINALKMTLYGMGDFALYALMCLYIKLNDFEANMTNRKVER